LRNLLQAAGVTVPKKKLKIDPARVMGKIVGIELTDDEYEGRMKSIITNVFDPDEIDDADTSAEDEDYEDDDEEEEEEKLKKKKAPAKKKKPVDEDEVDDEDLDELDLDEV
jgi:hypothetical protein